MCAALLVLLVSVHPGEAKSLDVDGTHSAASELGSSSGKLPSHDDDVGWTQTSSIKVVSDTSSSTGDGGSKDDTTDIQSTCTRNWTGHLDYLRRAFARDFQQLEVTPREHENVLKVTLSLLLHIRRQLVSVRLCKEAAALSRADLGFWSDSLEGVERIISMQQDCSPENMSNREIHDLQPATPPEKLPTFPTRRSCEFEATRSVENHSNGAGNMSTQGQSLHLHSQARMWTACLSGALKRSRENMQTADGPVLCRRSRGRETCPQVFSSHSDLHYPSLLRAMSHLLEFFTSLVDASRFLEPHRRLSNSTQSHNSNLANKSAPNDRFVEDASYWIASAYGSLTTGTVKEPCRYRRLCREINETLANLVTLPFILKDQTRLLNRTVVIVCGRHSWRSGGSPSLGQGVTFRTNNCTNMNHVGPEEELPCAVYFSLHCPSQDFVKTSRGGSPTSFSPEMILFKHIRGMVPPSVINQNWSVLHASWCRLSCSPQKTAAGTRQNFARDIVQIFGDFLFYFVVLLSIYLILSSKKNRQMMAKNPYRPYLYINFAIVYRFHIFTVSHYVVKGLWCNSDGSLVLGIGDATWLCLIEATLLQATSILIVLSFSWSAFVWRDAIMRGISQSDVHDRLGAASNSGLSRVVKMKIYEMIFCTTVLSMPVVLIVLVAKKEVLSESIEGSPPYKICIIGELFRSPFVYGTSAACLLVCGGAFLVFGRTLWRTRAKLRRLSESAGNTSCRCHSAQLTLRTWFRRHVLFLPLLLVHAVILVVFSAQETLKGDAQSYKMAVISYVQCQQALPSSCHAECRLKLPETQFSFYLFFALFGAIVAQMGSFSWIFFKEIEWPGLSRVPCRFRF